MPEKSSGADCEYPLDERAGVWNCLLPEELYGA